MPRRLAVYIEGAFAHDVEVEVVVRGGSLLDHAVSRAEAVRLHRVDDHVALRLRHMHMCMSC